MKRQHKIGIRCFQKSCANVLKSLNSCRSDTRKRNQSAAACDGDSTVIFGVVVTLRNTAECVCRNAAGLMNSGHISHIMLGDKKTLSLYVNCNLCGAPEIHYLSAFVQTAKQQTSQIAYWLMTFLLAVLFFQLTELQMCRFILRLHYLSTC